VVQGALHQGALHEDREDPFLVNAILLRAIISTLFGSIDVYRARMPQA